VSGIPPSPSLWRTGKPDLHKLTHYPFFAAVGRIRHGRNVADLIQRAYPPSPSPEASFTAWIRRNQSSVFSNKNGSGHFSICSPEDPKSDGLLVARFLIGAL
jgi:hypothetical protein